MKLFTILFLLSAVIALCYGNTLYFDTDVASKCSAKLNPCFFDDPSIWNNQNVNTGDSFNIDLSPLDNTNVSFSALYFETRSKLISGTFDTLYARGSQVKVCVDFVNTNGLTFSNVTFLNGDLEFTNTNISIPGNNFVITKTWYVENTTIEGVNTNIVSEGIYLDISSSMTFNQESNVQIDGQATFHGSISMDKSTIAITDVVDGYSVISNGIQSNSVVTLGKATLLGTSNIQTLSINGDTILSGATVTINGQLSILQLNQYGKLSLNQRSQVTLTGSADYYAAGIEINDNSTLLIQNFNTDIGRITGNGGIINYDVTVMDGGDFSNNNITGLNSTAVDIHISGKVELYISNSFGGSIIEVPTDQSTKLISFEQTNSFASISTSNSLITINDNSALSLWGTGNGIYGQNINVLGYLYLNEISITIGKQIVLMDTLGELVINGSNIFGNVEVVAGQVIPYGIAVISKNLLVGEVGSISFNSQTSSLNVGENCHLNGTLYFDSYVTPNTDPQFLVQGNIYFTQNSSVFVNFVTIPTSGQVYNLITFNGKASGTITHITLWLDGDLVNSLTTTVQSIFDNTISLVLEPSVKVHKKLPGWAAFLIIVAVVGTVAGVFYAFYRYKKREGYLPLN